MQRSTTLVISLLDSRGVLVLICGSYPRMAIPSRMAMPYGIQFLSRQQFLGRIHRTTQPRSHRHCPGVSSVPLKLVELMNWAIQMTPSWIQFRLNLWLITRVVPPFCRRVASPRKPQHLFPCRHRSPRKHAFGVGMHPVKMTLHIVPKTTWTVKNIRMRTAPTCSVTSRSQRCPNSSSDVLVVAVLNAILPRGTRAHCRYQQMFPLQNHPRVYRTTRVQSRRLRRYRHRVFHLQNDRVNRRRLRQNHQPVSPLRVLLL